MQKSIGDSNSDGTLGTLWFDLKSSIRVAEIPEAFSRRCDLQVVVGLDDRPMEEYSPDLVVIEFDYPSRADMDRAAKFKVRHASVPMVILTVQHSEALAVWFFRKKFVDFLVQPVSSIEADGCLTDIMRITKMRRAQVARELAEYSSSVPLEVSRGLGASQPLRPAIDLIAANYFEPLTVSLAAEACEMLPFRFGREFKEAYGVDFREYVMRFRIREACRLLRNPHSQVSEVAYAVGFSEPAYFTKTFKKLIGVPPSQVVGDQSLQFEELTKTETRDSKIKSRKS